MSADRKLIDQRRSYQVTRQSILLQTLHTIPLTKIYSHAHKDT